MSNQDRKSWLDDHFLVIAGPCAIEKLDICLRVAQHVNRICKELGFTYIFKASFDKANRTRFSSPRGPGIENGLMTLAEVQQKAGVRVTTDIHETWQAAEVAPIVDLIQIPAFLSRQTDLIIAAAETGLPVNIKKGQFVAPWDVPAMVDKAVIGGASNVLVTERGTSFGYGQVVVDMRGLLMMRNFGCRVVFDTTHSIQLSSPGLPNLPKDSDYILPLARAAMATGIDGVFFEVHPNPEMAISDGLRSLPLADSELLLRSMKSIRDVLPTFLNSKVI